MRGFTSLAEDCFSSSLCAETTAVSVNDGEGSAAT